MISADLLLSSNQLASELHSPLIWCSLTNPHFEMFWNKSIQVIIFMNQVLWHQHTDIYHRSCNTVNKHRSCGRSKNLQQKLDNKRGKCLFLMMSYPAQCERTNMSHMPQQQAIIVFRCIMFNNNRQYYKPITNLKYLMEVLLVDTRIQENVMFPTRM